MWCFNFPLWVSALNFPQKSNKPKTNNKPNKPMNRIKQLVAQLVAALTEAIKTPRSDSEDLLRLRDKYREDTNALRQEIAKLTGEEDAENAEEDELAKTLEEALVLAGAAKVPNPENVVDVTKIFTDADGDGKDDGAPVDTSPGGTNVLKPEGDKTTAEKNKEAEEKAKDDQQ